MSPYFKVAPCLPVNKLFTYSAKGNMEVEIGKRVLVPFGEKYVTGFVIEVLEGVKEKMKIREICDVLDSHPVINHQILKLCRWVSQYYICPLGEVLSLAAPPGGKVMSKMKVVIKSEDFDLDEIRNRAPLQAKILTFLLKEKEVSLEKLARNINAGGVYSSIHTLSRNGLIELIRKLDKPKVKGKEKKVVRLAIPKEEVEERLSLLPSNQSKILKVLLKKDGLQKIEVAKLADTSLTPINSLIKKGIIKLDVEEVRRDPYQGIPIEESSPLPPTPGQSQALKAIGEALSRREFKVVLLHGVTGSGKTEVYMQAVEQVITQGRGAIVLVPEISLIVQVVEEFKARFPGKVAILHSKLPLGERYDEWRRVERGEAPIVVGARSVIFAPLSNVGLIVVDEEHETTYKQSNDPKYNARDVAVVRGRFEGAAVILGSATPSLESYHNTQIKKYYYIELPHRIKGRCLPKVQVVDMRVEVRRNNKSIFSIALQRAIKERLRKGEQIILFLNKRGFASFIICKECGLILRCPNCNVTLTYHLSNHVLLCHYCNYSTSAPSTCPGCQGVRIGYFGLGTQRVERELKTLFPEIRVCRLDTDVSKTHRASRKIVSSFRTGEIDVLIGTQMVAKGFNFPEVTLVGVICADTALNLPDFRSAERTFSLLTQVAGRTGRGLKEGLVIIQTYNPNHYSIRAASGQNSLLFYKKEILFRKELLYPPFVHLIRIILKAKEEKKVIKVGEELGSLLRKSSLIIQALGPAPCPISKMKGEYRWQLTLKVKHPSKLNDLLSDLIERFEGVKVDVDVDPIAVM